ncbi:MAG: hypothetical protein Q9163_004223 [Psora crenata]
MPSLLRSKLTCFYCGCRSVESKTAGLRKWQCTKCEAENWLDENGEITDPPAHTSSVDVRFVQQQPKRQSTAFNPITPNTDREPTNLFCPTCLKNQHLLTQSLAQFYPSPTDPTFPAYERAEAEYRQSLEQRYPQVCGQCEPRVREKLKKANYDAKADHLGRVMQRLGGKRVVQEAWWKGWGIFLGGLIWWASWLGELGWHGLGLLDDEWYGLLPTMVTSLKSRATGFVDTLEVTPASFAQGGKIALCMAVLSIWWHPRLREKLDRKYGKLRGLSDYYKLQALTLAARWLVWYWIARSSSPDPSLYRPVHLFMMVFSIISISASYRTVTMDFTPKVSFKESPEPLNRPHNRLITSNDAHNQAPSRRQFSVRGNQRIAHPPSFSINDLAPPTVQPSNPRLPTPPPEADYDDQEAMDWTPSQTPLDPPSSSHIIPSPFRKRDKLERSPFHGTLPASVVSPAHRLRNPPNQPTFRAASAAKKQSLFSHLNPTSQATKPRSTGHDLDLTSMSLSLGPSTASAHEDEPLTQTEFSNFSPVKFNKPRFFPQTDYQTDTGLEGLLDKAFTLNEAPAEVQTAQRESHSLVQEDQHQTLLRRRIIWRAFFMLLAMLLGGLLCIGAWNLTTKIGTHEEDTPALQYVVKGLLKRFLAI